MNHETARHGGDVFAAARDLGITWREVLDYSANINPLEPPPGLKKHLFEDFDLTRNYPDPYALEWRTELAERHGLSPNEVLAGNGTTALMYLIARAIKPLRPVIVAPAFAEYEQALIKTGITPIFVPCREEDDFDLTRETVDRIFDRNPDMIFLGNPSSPAGRVVAPEAMEKLLTAGHARGTLIVLDEAFIDFTTGPSLADRVREYPESIVLRSLTKIYALPGLRLGYLTAAAPVVERLLAGFEPWSVNSLALAAGSYCLDREDYTRRTRETVARERKWLTGRFAELGFARIVPASANYFICRPPADGPGEEQLVAEARRRGVLIRECASFQGILKGYLRFAVKTRKPNVKLVETIQEIINRG